MIEYEFTYDDKGRVVSKEVIGATHCHLCNELFSQQEEEILCDSCKNDQLLSIMADIDGRTAI